MKKVLCVILSAVTLMFCLCSCSRGPKEGIYAGAENPETGAEPVVMLLADGYANFSLNQLTNGVSRASYTVDESNEFVTVTLKNTNTQYVFRIEKDSLVFVADKSDTPEDYNGQPALKDGDVLKLY